jgi:ABC-2 type transport system permease protein
MKGFVIAGRLIRQITGDKRTLVVMLIAPIIIMTLLYLLLGNGVTKAQIDIVDSGYEASDAMLEIARSRR